MKSTAVGSVACTLIVFVLPTLAPKSHARHVRTIAKPRLVPTAVTGGATTGTPTLASLVMLALNTKVIQRALKVVAQRSFF